MRVPTSILNAISFKRRAIAPAIALVVGLSADAGAALDISTIESAAGPWEIALLNTERRCGMQLRTEKMQAGDRMIGMPAGCRRALPILMDVGGWTVNADRTLAFDDRTGKMVLTFSTSEDDKLVAKGPEGETYELIATGRQRYAQASPVLAQQQTTPATPDRKSTRLNSSHIPLSRMPSSA